MKAIVYDIYGAPEVLRIKEVKKPVPKKNEVLIRIHGISVNYGDLIARNFANISPKNFNMPFLIWVVARLSFGIRKPKIKVLGNSFSGVIEAIGEKVKRFNVGDSVFGYSGEKMGAYAEYLCMPATGIIAVKPGNMTFEESSTIPYGGIMALNLLNRLNIQRGQKILIVGASGGIGSAAVQLAKFHFNAEVTGVCGTHGVDFVKKLGADKVIDYKKEQYVRSAETFDFILDILGKGSWSSYKHILNSNGICLFASFKMKKLIQMVWNARSRRKVQCSIATPKIDDLNTIKNLIEAGKIKCIIDKTFPLEQTAEAHKYIESGLKKGDVVIKVSDNDVN